MTPKIINLNRLPHFQGWFEAHVTVQPFRAERALVFDEICSDLGVKSIQIQLSRDKNMVQPMTCSTHKGKLQSTYKEVLSIAQALLANGFEVNRLKIEAHPDNQNVPIGIKDAAVLSSDNYFEHHIKVLVQPDTSRTELLSICEKHNAHLSKNAFKKRADGILEYFITTRSYGMGKNDALAQFQSLLKEVEDSGTKIQKHFMEYCVFDSNINLDDNWLDEVSPCLNCKEPCLRHA
ncbi:MAG: hypothetical protein ACPG5P_00770 [Saprospiraceae bacterium]